MSVTVEKTEKKWYNYFSKNTKSGYFNDITGRNFNAPGSSRKTELFHIDQEVKNAQ